MKRFKKQYGCPVELAIDVLNGKWKTVILARLKEGPHRYGELRARIFGMSDKVLTERLRDLEQLGFIKRRAGRNNAKETVYAITDRGESARPVLEALYAWGSQLSEELSIDIACASD